MKAIKNLRSKTSERYDVTPELTFKWSDIDSQEDIWEVWTPGSTFLVCPGYNSCEQDAIDQLLDWLQSTGKHPGVWCKHDDEYLLELRADAVRDGHDENIYVDEMTILGGNTGIYLHNPYQSVRAEKLR